MEPIIGIVGGLGPEGTIHYYRKLTERLGAVSFERGRPGIVIDHVWIDRSSALLRAHAEAESRSLLLGSLERLHRAGADVAMIAAVTPHKFLPAVRAVSPVPIVDLVSATRDDVLDDLIFGPVASGRKTPAMKQEIGALVRRMSARAEIDALVVACTDLMDLLDVAVPLLDPIDSHVRLVAEEVFQLDSDISRGS